MAVSQRHKSIFKKGFQVFHGFIFARVSLERVIHDLFQGIIGNQIERDIIMPQKADSVKGINMQTQ